MVKHSPYKWESTGNPLRDWWLKQQKERSTPAESLTKTIEEAIRRNEELVKFSRELEEAKAEARKEKEERTMINAERVIEAFKRTNGYCRSTMALKNHIATFEGKYDEDFLIDAVEKNKASDIYHILNEPFLELYSKTKNERSRAFAEENRLRRELKEQRERATRIDEGTAGIGLVERAIADTMAERYAPKLAQDVFKEAVKFLEKEYGKITKKVEYIVPERGAIADVVHEEFETVLNFVMADEPVMLIGPAGTGKNVICKQIAKALNLDFYFSNAVTQEYKLTGFIDAHGKFHETEFYKAFKNGGLFMLDEIDASIPEVLVILNAAIANRYFDFPNGKIEAHKDFRVIAAGNTFGLGASYQYVGRNQLDAASLDRFAQVIIDYSPTIEKALSDSDELLKFVRKFRKKCQDSGINHVVSYRCLSRMDKMSKALPKEKVLKSCLIKNLEEDDINMIVESFKDDSAWERAFREVARGK